MRRSIAPWTRSDLLVLLAIAALGSLQLVMSCRAADYLFDTNYVELARSITHHAGYGFNGKPMTQLPPGFPYLLAWLGLTGSASYAVVVRLMAASGVLALLLSYWLLRTQAGRGVAAAACLLLGSSPFLFEFSTRMVFTDVPYWLASILLIWGVFKLDAVTEWRSAQLLLWLAWYVGLVATIVVRSAGISLLGGMCCWIALGYFSDRKKAAQRLRRFLPAILLAAGAQGSWMIWAHNHQHYEWSIPGYQENYAAQLMLKNANDPELGMASWKDFLARPVENADNIGAAMSGLFTHKEMSPAWYFPGSMLPLVLVGLGLVSSIADGGLLIGYFICYIGMFLFWSWTFETRFLLPVAPLAFLYACRGGNLLVRMARARGSQFAWAASGLALAGCVSSVVWGRGVLHPQLRWCLALWVVVGVAAWAFPLGRSSAVQRVSGALGRLVPKGRSLTGWETAAAAVVVLAVLGGVRQEIPIGLTNLNSDVAAYSSYPDIEAAQWIGRYAPASSVIMARKDDIVFSYTRHRVIWFPPSRDAALLMDGIRRYHVQYVVVRYGDDTYWQPSVEECFSSLSHKYPGSFRLVHAGFHNSVFEVTMAAAPRTS